MKKLVLLAAMLFYAAPSFAQDTLVIDDGDNSIVTGIVESVRFNSIVIDVNGERMTVDTDDLNINDKADSFFPEGTIVKVVGDIRDNSEIKARKLIKLDQEQSLELTTEIDK